MQRPIVYQCFDIASITRACELVDRFTPDFDGLDSDEIQRLARSLVLCKERHSAFCHIAPFIGETVNGLVGNF